MVSMANHSVQKITKLLLIGESGSGKTSALASLAKAGYKLRILDFDAGSDILYNLLKSDPEALARVEYETLTDKLKGSGDSVVSVGVPTAFRTGLELLTRWKMKERTLSDGTVFPAYDLGEPNTWGPDTIIVIDTLTHMSNAAVRYCKYAIPQKDGRMDVYNAQQRIEAVLALLYSDACRANVIVNTHISYVGEEGSEVGYPSSIGKALNNKIGSYFNTILQVKTSGSGPNTKREIITQPEGQVALKVSAPIGLPRKLPLETGLADFFKFVRG